MSYSIKFDSISPENKNNMNEENTNYEENKNKMYDENDLYNIKRKLNFVAIHHHKSGQWHR
jgi:hypothetical protein